MTSRLVVSVNVRTKEPCQLRRTRLPRAAAIDYRACGRSSRVGGMTWADEAAKASRLTQIGYRRTSSALARLKLSKLHS